MCSLTPPLKNDSAKLVQLTEKRDALQRTVDTLRDQYREFQKLAEDGQRIAATIIDEVA